MDYISYWNTRGACGKGLLRNLKLLCNGPKPSILVLAETRSDNCKRFDTLKSLGYDTIRVMPSSGRSGGLVVAWSSLRVSVDVLEEDRQFFHLRCQFPQVPIFLLTVLYVIPHSDCRSLLWENLHRLSRGVQYSWSVIGDFNDISSASERIGGKSANFRRMQWFNDRIHDCGLIDLGSVGPKMTWKGPRISGCSRLYERLDRALANSAFLNQFTDAFVKVLPRTDFSDHNPLLLFVNNRQDLRRTTKPFRFEAMWMGHDSFSDFLRGNWSGPDNLHYNLEQFRSQITDWNRDVFGLVEKKKSDLLSRLNGIQRSSS
ncbi:hypothetical protein QN277_004437 [Acacia crassicarpa]|uniref:Endonuclease/exonuclease/phosphatase domain-containing protein n=1 Tax=Acacia crassicarpa TaxID=499986 RepID=A0AAE1J0F5_9FABA|nr:hypothetical protein QN277_004437 [Acacia crassicarpa]